MSKPETTECRATWNGFNLRGEPPNVPLRPSYWRYWLIFVPICWVTFGWKKMRGVHG